jgi:hypothetical protein
MMLRRFALTAAAFLIAADVVAQEPECAKNYRLDGPSSETFVLTSLSPRDVIQKLPSPLIADGVTMEWTQPEKGILKAEGLDVIAQVTGTSTKVTFRATPAAGNPALCRYASLVPPPVPPPVAVIQDPKLVAQLKSDLLVKQQIIQPGATRGLNRAAFYAEKDFLEFTIVAARTASSEAREYDVSIVLPRYNCGIAREEMDDSGMAISGQGEITRTKPARVEATLTYARVAAGTWRLSDAVITHIESVK